MQITSINPVYVVGATVSESEQQVSLADRMASAQADPVDGNEPGGPVVNPLPDSDPQKDYMVEEIYQWVLANQGLMKSDPKLMINGILSKVKQVTNSDGSLAFRSFNEIANVCTMLKDRCEKEGFADADFFQQLSVTVFGLTIFFDQMKQEIFFNSDKDKSQKFF